MLRALAISNFIIVDHLDLEFERGFTVLTGETGAGKSILVDALSLVLGERSDAGLVRDGCSRAEISAEFDIKALPRLASWLDENDLAGEADVCLLRRVLESNGRSRAYVNGRSSTLQQIKALGEQLVDIHGQHEHQSLLRTAAQRDLLDAFADAAPVADEVEQAWRRWQDLIRQRSEWERNADALATERQRLEWQIRELSQLAFTGDDWIELQADHRRLAHAASLIETVEYALDTLSDGETSAAGMVSTAAARVGTAQELDSGLKDVREMLDSAQIQMREAVHALRQYRQRIDLDPDRLREVELRLDAIQSVARKYRVAPERLPELLAQAKARLDDLGGALGGEALTRRLNEAHDAYIVLAHQLSAKRAVAARELGVRVTDAMQALAMAGGRFEIALDALADGTAHGLEQIEFRVAIHPGSAPRSLAKVASGGELSRLSLAIQSVTSAVAELPVLVFDEVDAGIGGRVAEIVGRMLKKLGKSHQVMCITHLPQVAAAADQQWQVARREHDGRVLSSVKVLEPEQRVAEIARMLGGVKITETTRRHAAEMLGVKT